MTKTSTTRPKLRKGEILEIYTDGASRGNPGPSAIGYVFVVRHADGSEEIIESKAEYIGEATNNTAEYMAIIWALENAHKVTMHKVIVYSDSKLVVNQINRRWRIIEDHLGKLFQKVCDQKRHFKEDVEFRWISRSHKYLQKADELCNRKLDEIVGKPSRKKRSEKKIKESL